MGNVPDLNSTAPAGSASVLDDLRWRGLIAQSTDESELATAMAAGPITFYGGFDPTARSLHIGNLVLLLTMRRIQSAGHLPLGLVGGATGLIGDPRMSGERVLNGPDVVADWVAQIQAQVEKYLDFSGPFAARIVNNLDWTAPMSAIDFLRDVGQHFRMGRMLSKEIVSARLNSDEGLSFTEFSYQILQGMDFLELYRRYACVLQLGGNDQWGNLTSGTELIRKAEGKVAHALTTPLITKADGTKFGKTETGTVWLDAELTSPYAFYQFWFNVEDASVDGYLKVFSFRGREELEAIAEATATRPHAREAQRALAEELTTLVHGPDATRSVITASGALFGRGELTEVDESTLAAALAEAGLHRLTEPMPTAVELLRLTGLAGSASEARRTIKEGGASINNQRISDPEHVPAPADLLHGRFLVIRRGKRAIAGIRLR
jgi:tyrosyl-tRNA synthetase